MKNLFATPHWECVNNIFAKACYYAFLDCGGFPWARVLEIEAEDVRPPRKEEKRDHDEDFDKDEVLILKGTVIHSYDYQEVVEMTDEWHRSIFRKYF